MFSACNKQSSLKLITSKTLNFPSASGIEFYRDTVYVFGDNATYLLLLSPDYRQVGSYTYWNSQEPVIEKDEKPDIESAMIIERMNQSTLIGVGSMSAEKRWNVIELPIGYSKLQQTQFFQPGMSFSGIEEINIEGSTAFGDRVLFCNRANLKTRKNHLLFWNGRDSIKVKQVGLPKTRGIAGMSGLCYVSEKDLLLFTASEEATTNAIEDGAIGGSYLGWITNFSKESEKGEIEVSGFLKLSAFDKAFAQQKIESVCMEKHSGNHYILHLVADNDNGKSVLFKVDLKLSE